MFFNAQKNYRQVSHILMLSSMCLLGCMVAENATLPPFYSIGREKWNNLGNCRFNGQETFDKNLAMFREIKPGSPIDLTANDRQTYKNRLLCLDLFRKVPEGYLSSWFLILVVPLFIIGNNKYGLPQPNDVIGDSLSTFVFATGIRFESMYCRLNKLYDRQDSSSLENHPGLEGLLNYDDERNVLKDIATPFRYAYFLVAACSVVKLAAYRRQARRRDVSVSRSQDNLLDHESDRQQGGEAGFIVEAGIPYRAEFEPAQ